jgi:hypothetical protein
MWVRRSFELQKQLDLVWINDLARFVHHKGSTKKIEELKETFLELYLENLRDGLSPTEALEKAKLMIFCFLFLFPRV